MHFLHSDVDDGDDCDRSNGNFRRTLAAPVKDFCQGKANTVFLFNYFQKRLAPLRYENDVFQERPARKAAETNRQVADKQQSQNTVKATHKKEVSTVKVKETKKMSKTLL